jgi:hypothetical protein
MPEYEQTYIIAFALTVISELSVLLILLKKIYTKPVDISWVRVFLSGFIASFATLPWLWYFIPNIIHDRIAAIIIGEALVFIIEGIIYSITLQINFSRAFIISTFCNITSIIVGLIIF